jgi:hypothetical protein
LTKPMSPPRRAPARRSPLQTAAATIVTKPMSPPRRAPAR